MEIELNQYLITEALKDLKREGIEDLVQYLNESDYFIAPASTKHHRSYAGGLAEHSLNVTSMFKKRNDLMGTPLEYESVTICGLLHDLCKIGLYKIEGSKYKTIVGHPAQESHAKLSIDTIENFIQLKPIEKDIILYHMGLFGCYGYCVEYTPEDLYRAIARNPIVQIFAACDMKESKWRD